MRFKLSLRVGWGEKFARNFPHPSGAGSMVGMSDKYKAMMQEAASRSTAWRVGIDKSIHARRAMLSISLAAVRAVEQERSGGPASTLSDSAKDGSDAIEWSVGGRKVRIRASMDGMIVVSYDNGNFLQARHDKLEIPKDDPIDAWAFGVIQSVVLFLHP